MDPADLFGSLGIYTNSMSRGGTWERPASVELIYPNEKKGFQINAAFRVHGGGFSITQTFKEAFV